MARTSRNRNFDAKLGQLQRQARGLLTNLRGQIRAAEIELARLRKDESRISRLFGGSHNGAPAAARRLTRSSGRTDWTKVLRRMPKQFKAANVRAVRGLKAKRASEIFAAITRWIDAGTAKRRGRGTYERVKA